MFIWTPESHSLRPHESLSLRVCVCILFPVGWNFLRQRRSCLNAESWYILRSRRNQQVKSINWCSGTCEAVVCVAGNVLRALRKISQWFTKREPHSTLPMCQGSNFPEKYHLRRPENLRLHTRYLTSMSVGLCPAELLMPYLPYSHLLTPQAQFTWSQEQKAPTTAFASQSQWVPLDSDGLLIL